MSDDDRGALTPARVEDAALEATRPAVPGYYVALLFLVGGIGAALISWILMVKIGMGLAGISHPIGWATYITNFVFWIGIAHSGTLISAILYLVRARFRDAISRASEAMTVFAVMTAGLFPLIHLGRFWVFYYIIPYPSQRDIWPNFKSPLVWDLVAISTYLTVSVIFWYVGLIPDAAAGRDWARRRLGPKNWRTRLWKAISLGWTGSWKEWRHFGRAYLFFAALATPLVVSVHSIVSWDFAMSLLPGWHSTIFAPYFVAGAIHSGLAMVLTLLIPLRVVLHLQNLIKIRHLEMVAKMMIVTTLIVLYTYILEPGLAFYGLNLFEKQFTPWRMTGWISWAFYLIVPFNALIPLVFAIKRLRRSLPWLFVVAILVDFGMWIERFWIIAGSLAHDFLPHNWGTYLISIVESLITAGALAWFLFFFLVFSKTLPTVPVTDYKMRAFERMGPRGRTGGEGGTEAPEGDTGRAEPPELARSPGRLVASFRMPRDFVEALRRLVSAGIRDGVDVRTPYRVGEVGRLLGKPDSPVRLWTLAGGIAGFIGGYALCILTARENMLIVHGKPVVQLIPYLIVGFEGMVLLGSLANLAGLLVHAGLLRRWWKRPERLDDAFRRDRFGIVVAGPDETLTRAAVVLSQTAEPSPAAAAAPAAGEGA